MTIALYAEFSATPGNEARVVSLLSDLAAVVRAEPGNVVFDPHLITKTGRFYVYEVYRDEVAFAAHMTSKHCATFNLALSSLVDGGGSRLTMLTPIDTVA
ncbi:MAG: antibiotic biosynthesis monooxygenase [Microbacteriaceae bacterium]|nr:antibiotic biosynthesis monooxygenase [Microbacteriaceae bacterium]